MFNILVVCCYLEGGVKHLTSLVRSSLKNWQHATGTINVCLQVRTVLPRSKCHCKYFIRLSSLFIKAWLGRFESHSNQFNALRIVLWLRLRNTPQISTSQRKSVHLHLLWGYMFSVCAFWNTNPDIYCRENQILKEINTKNTKNVWKTSFKKTILYFHLICITSSWVFSYSQKGLVFCKLRWSAFSSSGEHNHSWVRRILG